MKNFIYIFSIYFFISCLFINPAPAQSLIKVKELNSQSRIESLDDDDLIVLNNKIIGSISDSELGNEIFVSDGTQAGTSLLLDLQPGPKGSNGDDFVVFNNFVYFAATTDALGEELWRTDGTPSGTSLVADMMPGTQSGRVSELTVLETGSVKKLLFRAESPGKGRELCILDSTSVIPECTNLNPTGDSTPNNITRVGSGTLVFFSADDGVNGVELFKTNGTVAGTVFFKDLNPGPNGSFPDNFKLIPAGNAIVFSAFTDAEGDELWVSNGSAAGTELLTDINNGQFSSNPDNFTALGGFIYFTAADNLNGRELWRTSGISGGTSLVSNINPGPDGSNASDLTVLNGVLYFSALRNDIGSEIFFSDGSAQGTGVLKDIYLGDKSSSPDELTLIGDKIFFSARTETDGEEPWVTDGSINGTIQLINFSAQNANSSANKIVNFNNKALFSIDNNLSGDFSSFFISSDGSPAGTKLDFSLIRPGTAGAGVSSLALAGNRLFFKANDGLSGNELYISDGSAAGTTLVKDLAQGPLNSNFSSILSIGSKVIFEEISGIFNFDPNTPGAQKLFVSDGSHSGTSQYFTFNSDIFTGSIANSARLGERLVFPAIASLELGLEPWITDGTAPGTFLLKDIVTGGLGGLLGSNPQNFTAAGNKVFFTAGFPLTNLWVTDGTSDGTVEMSNSLQIQSVFGFPAFLDVNGTIFFSGNLNFQSGFELFKSDGTPEGTVIVKDINSASAAASSSPFLLGRLNQDLIFSAETQDNGRELWKSNGTEGGTTFIKNITPGSVGTNFSTFSSAAEFNGKLYFVIDAGTSSSDLWATDGTEEGTNFVAKIRTPIGSSSGKMIIFDNKLFFTGNDGNSGIELWSSDGSTAGTQRFADIAPGPADSDPNEFVLLGDILVFTADDRTNGRELYALIASDDQCPADINKKLPGACGCGITDTDADNSGLPDCIIPTPTNVPDIIPGTPSLKVKKNKLSFTLPLVDGASYEIIIRNKKGKLIKSLTVNKPSGLVKKLKPGRYSFSYRILAGVQISVKSSDISFRIKKPVKR